MSYRTRDEAKLTTGCNGELDGAERRYVRFEPVTVGAAARVLERKRAGVISACEAAFYLRELLVLDAHAGPEALPSLLRAAQRRPGGRMWRPSMLASSAAAWAKAAA